MRREAGESTQWFDLAKQIVNKGKDRLEDQDGSRVPQKVQIPNEILAGNQNLIDLKLTDSQVEEIKNALEDYQTLKV